MLTQLFGLEVMDLFFQHDGAGCYTAREIRNLLYKKFLSCVISRNGNGNCGWPPILCYLTLLDFFLWGFLKDQVYANNPQTDGFKNNIRAVIITVCRGRGGNFSEFKSPSFYWDTPYIHASLFQSSARCCN